MRRFGIAAAVVVVAGAISGGATLASGDNGEGSGHGHGHRGNVFTVYAPTAADRIAFVPVASGKFSLGDRTVFSDDLFTSKGGKSLGIDGGVCTVVRITDAASVSGVLECHITFSLPAGQITTQELHTLTNGNLTGTQPGAITGGTGKYRNASGQVSVKFISTTEAYVTFVLDD
jgi:hypothetical protein